jgi:hypothetical protein
VSPVLALRGIGVITPEEAGGPLDLGLLPRSLRRGLSEVMKLAIAVAGRTLAAAGIGPGPLPIVYGSAFGESRTALELLTSITAAGESSPVLFRHSVHNAAPGLLSIALGSGAPATAVAAGEETMLACLLEAGALLREGHSKVLVVLADDAIPAELSPRRPSRPGAVAMLLSSDAAQESPGYVSGPELGDALAPGPVAPPLGPAFALAAASAQQSATRVALSTRQPWQLRFAPSREALS